MPILVQGGSLAFALLMALLSHVMQPLPDSSTTLSPNLGAKKIPEAQEPRASSVPRRTASLSASAKRCLVKNMYWEARGEGWEGMKAVAQVTLNRVKSDKWPDTVCGVVRQPHQFSWTRNLRWDRPLTDEKSEWRAAAIAQHLDASGWTQLGNDTWSHHFVQTRIADSWEYSDKLDEVRRVGNHQFYS